MNACSYLRNIFIVAVAWIALVGANVAIGQAYPARTVRIVDVFSAGGSTDTVARILAAKLGSSLNQSVIVENRPGAGGKIGTEYVTKAAPDGYTLFLGLSMALSVNAALYKLPYDTLKDIAPIAGVATGAFVMVSHPSLPATSVKELISLAKAHPGAINFSSSGNGSGGHLFGELLKSRADIKITHVPYNGVVPAVTAVMTGEVSIGLITVASGAQQIKSGRLKALGITSPRRSAIMPNVPTIAESGLPGFEIVATYAMYAPAHTPASVISRLNDALQKAVSESDVRERFAALGIEPSPSSPDEVASKLKEDLAKWGVVIRNAGIRVD